MNTIDLLDKLNLPGRIGLEGDDALFSKQVIMDAYLSAASLQFNRQLFGLDSTQSCLMDGRSHDATQSLNGLSADLPKASANIDLFKAYTPETRPTTDSFESNDTKVVVDLMKVNNPLEDFYESKANIFNCQEGSSQGETESESYTKLEAEQEKLNKTSRKGKKKVDKSNIGEFIAEERRRLMKKLEACDLDRIVYKRRIKNSKKDPKISADNYRGSRFWGVSKNKSKWQVT